MGLSAPVAVAAVVVDTVRYRLRPSARLFLCGQFMPLSHPELVEQEARRMCREMDMPESCWPDMSRTMLGAGRVLSARLHEFNETIKREAKRLLEAAGMQ